jgi:two-component system cell cycle sensor histidine kinase/response regulator CckA
MADPLALVDCFPEAVAIHRDGRLLFVNRAWLSWLGYLLPEDVVGRPVLDFVHPEDRGVTAAALRELIERGPPAPVREERLVRRDGSVLETEVAAHFAPFEGRPAVVAIFRDVGERKRQASARAEMQARLMVSERMASVGTLAASVAHEINNPLGALVACLQTMDQIVAGWEAAKPNPGLEQLEDALDDARASAERVRVIVRDLGAFSRPGDEAVSPVDVRRALESALHLARNPVHHRARVVKDYGPMPRVHANEQRLEQVFVNLLVNASQALADLSGERCEIRLTTFTDRQGRAVVEVRDSGEGISSEARIRLFEAFFSNPPDESGLGQGLSISRGIVRGLGGEIEVESEPARGATFRVVLPPAAAESAPSASAPAPLPRARILVVDDDPAFARSLHRLLEREHDVVSVESGADALALLARDSEFDLVLCDVMMPSMSGPELYQALNDRMPWLVDRLALMTGGVFTSKATAFLAEARLPCLEKPLDVQALRALIRTKHNPAIHPAL